MSIWIRSYQFRDYEWQCKHEVQEREQMFNEGNQIIITIWNRLYIICIYISIE